jgi:hypothetical protein
VKRNQEVYLYGIIPAQIGLVSDCEGVANLKVHAVPVGGVAVLASYMDLEQPNLNIEDAVKHVKVLETAMNQSAVIPIKFGTVVESFEELKKLIQARSELLKKELQRLDHASLIAKAQLVPQDALELGQRVEAVVNEFRTTMENTIHPYLSAVAEENTTGEMMSTEMLYNGSFLVNSLQDEALKKRVEKTAQKYPEMIEFHYTTKLPPYNFVKMNLSRRRKT